MLQYEAFLAERQLQALYNRAVEDAKTIEPEELLPVTAIAKDSPMVTWNHAGDRVLLLTFYKYPDSYPPGKEATTGWGKVWAFTDKEIKDRYAKNKAGVTDWHLRFVQLIGLEPENANTHFSALWTKPEDMIRSAYVWDMTQSQMADRFCGAVAEGFALWFSRKQKDSYESQWRRVWLI